jgi:hypothetical protein
MGLIETCSAISRIRVVSHSCFVLAWLVAFMSSSARVSASDWIPLNYPGATGTQATAVNGGSVVGSFWRSDGLDHGFLYDGANYTAFDAPGATSTIPLAIASGVLGGQYSSGSSGGGPTHGFLYDGAVYTTVDFPGARDSCVTGISGNYVMGNYDTAAAAGGFTYSILSRQYKDISYPGAKYTTANSIFGNQVVGTYQNADDINHGFLFNNDDFEAIDFPGAYSTQVTGVSGNYVLGTYAETRALSSPTHAFLYDGRHYTTLDPPAGLWDPSMGGEGIGISGSNIVVEYAAPNFTNWAGFLFDGTNWTAIGPSGLSIGLSAIDGSSVVGTYHDTRWHGFLFTVPEPSTLALLTVGTLAALACAVGRRHSAGRR